MKRNYLILIALAIVAVVALILSNMLSGQSPLIAYDNVALSGSFSGALQTIPNSVFSAVGIGAAGNFATKINQPPLELNGKPEILYIGSNYCPYCAAERWPMIIALSRFGIFSNLHYMTSSSSDYAPSTPTFTFYNSTYTSSYITFVAVEMQSNKLVNGTYPTLQTLNETENNIINTINPAGGIPFIDFANLSFVSGSTYSPLVLQNKNWSVVMAQLNQTNSTIAQSIIGSANLITAQICKATNNTPASVCSQSYITRIQSFT